MVVALDVLLAQSGDRQALDRVLRACERPLYAHLVRLCRHRADAEDALQETFVTLIKKLSHLREPALFMAWARRVASRVAYRRRSRGVGVLDLDEPHVADPEHRVMAHDVIRALPPASRVVVVLHYLEGLSLQDIASELAIPVGTVKSRLAYARKLAAAL